MSISRSCSSAYSIGSAQSVPPNGRLLTVRTASSRRCRGLIASGVMPSVWPRQTSRDAARQPRAAGEEADRLVPRLGRRRHEGERGRGVTRRQARHAGHRAAAPSSPRRRARAGTACRSARRSRTPCRTRRRARRRSAGTGVQLCRPRTPLARRVGAQRRQERDRVNARLADALAVAELGDHLRRAVRARREHADAGHRRQVADERRHRHVLEQRLPDLGRGQVLARDRLARQAVLADELGRPGRRLRRLGEREALDDPRQAVGRAAARRSTRTGGGARRSSSSVGLPAPTRPAGWASRSRSRCVMPSRWRYLTAW